jgi:formate dehydrogenase maturation protein FdhE
MTGTRLSGSRRAKLRRYVKSIDSPRPAAARCVDDLVSIAMDLWAVDQGYSRIEPGLAGI